MGANAYSRAQAATKFEHPVVRYVLGWLAQVAWDEDFTGYLDFEKFRLATGMKERALRRAIHDIECSTEVTFHPTADGRVIYRMLWATFHYLNSLDEAPPIPMEWPLEFRQMGVKCPRPKRIPWTKEDDAERKEFRVLHREIRQADADERRESRRQSRG